MTIREALRRAPVRAELSGPGILPPADPIGTPSAGAEVRFGLTNEPFVHILPDVQRLPVADRLSAVVEAAVQVFSEKGYEGAQMADIAAVLGIGAGGLYNYVESKQGLFALCLERLMHGEDVLGNELPLPVRGRSLDLTLLGLREQAERSLRLPRLRAASEEPVPADPEAELTGVVSELYDLISRTRQLADIVERSARDTPELAAVFYEEWRAPLTRRLQAYLRARIEGGAFHPLNDVAVAASFVIETVSWFARHRFHDVEGRKLDEQATEPTVVALIVRAFLPRESVETSEEPLRRRSHEPEVR